MAGSPSTARKNAWIRRPTSAYHNHTTAGVRDTWAGPINPKLYGDGIQNLCRQTQNNLDRLKLSMTSNMDPCVQYGLKHWHPEHRPTSAGPAVSESQESSARWKDASVMFTSTDVIKTLGDPPDDDAASDIGVSGYFNTFCYLCSTLEEHRRHLLHHRAPKRTSGKARIEYIAPPPRVKRKGLEDETFVPERLYRVDVFTADKIDAGTVANVSVTIKGSLGLLPKTKLYKGRGSSHFSFMRNTKETFFIKGPNLGHLEMLTVQHDGLEKRHGWLLNKIEVTDMKASRTWVFMCGLWLSLHIRDFRIKRDLEAKLKEVPHVEYHISVVTGKKKLAGTDANVYVTLYGKDGTSRKVHLVDATRGKVYFEKGKTDNFRISIPSIGNLRSLRVEHDGTRPLAGWFLDKIIIRNEDNPKETYFFSYNGWIAKDVGEGLLWRVLKAHKTEPKEIQKGTNIRYEITVRTGDVLYAGTDANVFIQMCGSKGITKKLTLDDAKNNFERGMTDAFQLDEVDVGPLTKIVIGHDSFGPGAGWFMDDVKIRRHLPKKEILEYLRKEKNKLVERKDRKKAKDEKAVAKGLDRQLSAVIEDEEDEEEDRDKDRDKKERKQKIKRKKKQKTESETSDSESDEDDSQIKGKKKKDKINTQEELKKLSSELRVPLFEEYYFPCKKWFAEDEGDGLTVRELVVDKKEVFFKD